MDGTTLSCAGVAAVARRGALVAIAPGGLDRAAAAYRAAREAAAAGPFYGRTTGVGANGMTAVAPGNGHGLRLLRSHVGGAGEPVDGAVARGMLAVRLNQLAVGGSGADPAWLEAAAAALNEGLTPGFPVLGGIGTADLAALAAAAMVPRLRTLLACELVVAARGLRQRDIQPTGPRLRAVFDRCVAQLPADDTDRPLDTDIAAAEEVVAAMAEDHAVKGVNAVAKAGLLE
jgi:histidine ammonia-lyase